MAQLQANSGITPPAASQDPLETISLNPPPITTATSGEPLSTNDLSELLESPAHVFGNSSQYERNPEFLPHPDKLNQAIVHLARLRGIDATITAPPGEYDSELLRLARSEALLDLPNPELNTLTGAQVHGVVRALQQELATRGLTVEQLEPVIPTSTVISPENTVADQRDPVVSPVDPDHGQSTLAEPTPDTIRAVTPPTTPADLANMAPTTLVSRAFQPELPPLGPAEDYLPSPSNTTGVLLERLQRYGQITSVIASFDDERYSRDPWRNPTFNLSNLDFSGASDCMSHQYFLTAIGANLMSDSPRSLSADFLRDWGIQMVGENMRMSPGSRTNSIPFMERAFYDRIGETSLSNGRLSGLPYSDPSIDIMHYPPGTYVGLGTSRENIVHGITILGYVDSSGARWRWDQAGNLRSNQGQVVSAQDIGTLNFVDFEVLNVSTSNTSAANQVFISTLTEEMRGTMSYNGSSHNVANFYRPNYYRLPENSGPINSPVALHNRSGNLVAFTP